MRDMKWKEALCVCVLNACACCYDDDDDLISIDRDWHLGYRWTDW